MSKIYNVIGIRFSGVGKTYYFDPRNFSVKIGDNVIVETARGLEYGTAVTDIKEVAEDEIVQPLKPIQRMATEHDKKKLAEYTFDRGKIIFYFTASNRVDFRELVKDLAGIFKTRIELRQVGVRDEAKHIGGYGSCGRSLCCSTFLSEFETISIKMAKNQNISPNPTKINGVCGRLMCCLKYEDESYLQKEDKSQSVGNLIKLYEQGFHICHGSFGRMRDEDCIFCLNVIDRTE